MISSVFIIGGVLTVVSIILGVVLVKASAKASYTGYIPGAAFGIVGLLLLLLATFTKVDIMGAGFGGWGIACLFAAMISLIVTSTVDVFGQKVKA